MSKFFSFEELAGTYTRLLRHCNTRPNWVAAIERAAQYGWMHRERYAAVAAQFPGMRWQFIAALHWRESDGDFRTHLHNGDRLTARTRHVPAGRPVEGTPPFAWDFSAIDALRMKGLQNLTPADWDQLERVCYEAEKYNGFGYQGMHPSPYVWSGTSIYDRGKYVADHLYSASTRDKQIGVLPIYLRMRDIERENTPAPPPAAPETAAAQAPVVSWNTGMRLVRRFVEALSATVGSIFTLDFAGLFERWFNILKGSISAKVIIGVVVCGVVIWTISKMAETHADDAQEKKLKHDPEPPKSGP